MTFTRAGRDDDRGLLRSTATCSSSIRSTTTRASAMLYDLGSSATPLRADRASTSAVRRAGPPHWYGGGASVQGDATRAARQLSRAGGLPGDATFLRCDHRLRAGRAARSGRTMRARRRRGRSSRRSSARRHAQRPGRARADRCADRSGRAAGVVGGDEPVTFDATDNAGIKRASSSTSPPARAPKVVGEQGLRVRLLLRRAVPAGAGAQLAPRAGSPPGSGS